MLLASALARWQLGLRPSPAFFLAALLVLAGLYLYQRPVEAPTTSSTAKL